MFSATASIRALTLVMQFSLQRRYRRGIPGPDDYIVSIQDTVDNSPTNGSPDVIDHPESSSFQIFLFIMLLVICSAMIYLYRLIRSNRSMMLHLIDAYANTSTYIANLNNNLNRNTAPHLSDTSELELRPLQQHVERRRPNTDATVQHIVVTMPVSSSEESIDHLMLTHPVVHIDTDDEEHTVFEIPEEQVTYGDADRLQELPREIEGFESNEAGLGLSTTVNSDDLMTLSDNYVIDSAIAEDFNHDINE